ncbi:cellulose synthase complex outer membrane protein BcsC [Enterobacter sp. ENT03]|uniref:cellulose synthase complex outer membrane protein BcsC n=1 Tax=Enterobacter sp. ENT03 TaxID=2854780 RepID=UPI001C462ED9|nr:cellulose synthase complex outer membrane protein BcsC [Enterobacter sp. ENT03]MBV7407093.1 cellulose biosynthesis protein BcsC [Enterobacter sp. ENT03]
MRRLTLRFIALSLGFSVMPNLHAASGAEQQLLNQVRLGEATKRDDLVRQSLHRLELIDPANPDVIAARFRYLLRQGDTAGAQKQLDRLQQLAPDSSALRDSRGVMTLSTPEGRQALQEARLQGTTGHTQEAIAAYDKLFNGNPPPGEIAREYWVQVAKIPARRNEAINQLKALNARRPGDGELQNALAQLLFASDRPDEGYAVLQQMAKSGTNRDAAAAIWYQQIKDLPVSDASVQALQRFLAQFSEGDNVEMARQQLAEQQQKLADPAFRARSQGLAAVDAGQGSNAISALQQAVSADERDGEAIGALGQAYSQKGDRARAVEHLQKAIALAPQSSNRSKWDSLLQTNRYWLLIQQGDAALKANNPAAATRFYQQAQQVDNTDSYAVLGLGDAALARKESDNAERYYRQALRMDSENSNAVRGLANLYRAQSPERAQAFIQTLNTRQRRSIDDIERSMTGDRLAQQAEALENRGEWAQAADVQRQRLALDAGSVWITYRLASDLRNAGQRAQGDAQMRDLAAQKPNDVEQVYAYGLYLSGNDDQGLAALAHLNTLPKSQWTPSIQALAERLQRNQLLARANQLRDSGNEPAAMALLKAQPASASLDLTLADWAQQRGDYPAASALYNAVLAKEPNNLDARLSLAEVALAQRNPMEARAQLAKITPDAAQPLSMNTERRRALVQAQLGDTVQAQQTFARLVPQAKSQPPSQDSALVLRDAARLSQAAGEPQQALEGYKDAMVAAGITPVRPQDNDAFTQLTRSDEKDDWLRRGVRSDAAELYRQQDVNVTLSHDYGRSDGTGGYSDLKMHTTMLQADAPLADGRMFFRTDRVNMDAGTFSRNKNGNYDPNWGTCGQLGCDSIDNNQRDNGTSVAVGWRNDTWNMDIGTTPMGFEVVDVVGGLSYSNDLGPVGYTLNLHRRAISSSLLAFGGQKDAKGYQYDPDDSDNNRGGTGKTWGGVRASGGGVSMSYDRGEAHGVWASLNADTLTGKNVADNWRVRWMTGYYYKLINKNDERMTVGLNNMIWHYDKDLSGYSLGQGGYYSPQEYVSFAVPVTWRKRTENWSWELGGSGSWSHSRTQKQITYPVLNIIPDVYRTVASEQSAAGGSSRGFGYTAHALVERRISSKWSIGAGIDIQQAKDYTPSHGMIFVRYSDTGWQGDMDMPPQPLMPYADW